MDERAARRRRYSPTGRGRGRPEEFLDCDADLETVREFARRLDEVEATLVQAARAAATKVRREAKEAGVDVPALVRATNAMRSGRVDQLYPFGVRGSPRRQRALPTSGAHMSPRRNGRQHQSATTRR